jgi:hypothetical protein
MRMTFAFSTDRQEKLQYASVLAHEQLAAARRNGKRGNSRDNLFWQHALAPMQPMKVLLRSVRTGRYLSGADQWSEDPEEGMDFRHMDRAVDRACAARWQDVEVILWFNSQTGSRELRFPIS